MDFPLVSIIIPCYNAERTIGEAIESALQQSYRNIEVIVIDDGSTDESLRVIQSFGDRIRWEMGPNRGGCAARNRGIEMAQGDLIQFLDADDLLHPGKLEVQVPLVLQRVADIVCCSWQKGSYGKPAPMEPIHIEFKGEDCIAFLLRAQLQTASPVHWKRNLLSINGFNATLPCSQERDLHLRLACQGFTFCSLREILLTVRRIDGSVSSDWLKAIDQHRGIFYSAYEAMRHKGMLTGLRARAIARALTMDARVYIRHGRKAEARENIDLARQICSAGIIDAYERKLRPICRIFGPFFADRLANLKRSYIGRRDARA